MNERDKLRGVDLHNPPPPPGMRETPTPSEPEKPVEKREGAGKQRKGVPEPLASVLAVLIVGSIFLVVGWLLVKAVGLTLSVIWKAIVFLTPYGRAAAADPLFRYCLHWCSGCVVVIAIVNVFVCVVGEMIDLGLSLLGSLVVGFCVWYCGYGLSFALVKVPIFFPYLAPVLMVAGCAAVAFMLIKIEAEILY